MTDETSKAKPTEREISFAKKLMPDNWEEAAQLLAEQREWRTEVAALPTTETNNKRDGS